MATSPAQQAYREYIKEINAMTRHIVYAIKSGELYTYDILVSFYQEMADIHIEYFESEDFDMETWQGRIEDTVGEIASMVTSRFNLPLSIPDEPAPEPGEGSSVDEIAGYPIITTGDCIAGGARVRGIILLTLEELVEYIEPIPAGAIRGIVVIQDNKGVIKGFSICVSKNSS